MMGLRVIVPAALCALLTLPAFAQSEPAEAAVTQQNTSAATGELNVNADGNRVITGDHTLEEGEVVSEIVVVGGSLRVRGTVQGNAVVVGGDLVLEPSGEVQGDALVTDGRIVNEGGSVGGEMRIVESLTREASSSESAAGSTERSVERSMTFRQSNERAWFAPIQRGLAGLISTLAFGLVLGGIGGVLVFYGRPYLETVSDTVRAAPWRSAGVGLAANFLVIPLFVALVLLLTVTLVGIPLLIVVVPLYPLLIAAAAAFGLLATAHAIGERTAEQGELRSLRNRNSYAYLFTGLGMLIAPLLAAHLLGMTGFLGFISTMLRAVSWAAIWICGTVGLGAVILSRAGRRAFMTSPPTDFDDGVFDEETTTGDIRV